MAADSESFPPPNSPGHFESLCLDLWKDIWGAPGAQKNGRSGQPQAGVDVYGQQDGCWIGVQCKQKDRMLRGTVTVKELEHEVRQSLTFKPALSSFILATTGPADVKVQQRARELSEEHGLIVEVWSWTKIWHEIHGRAELLRRIGPHYWPQLWRLAEELKPTTEVRVSALKVHGPVPAEPPHYLLRNAELAKLRTMLTADIGCAEEMTRQSRVLGVQGMGGVGKTVLAAALTRDASVHEAYPDGIFWLTVGAQPNVLNLLNDVAAWIPDCDQAMATETEAGAKLRKALAGKRALLILDDVWDLDHAAALRVVSRPGRLFVTTRNRDVLVGLGSVESSVDVLTAEAALRMLSNWVREPNPGQLPTQAADVARECGYLPLALAMIGAMFQLRPAAWADVLELLRGRDLGEFRRRFPDYPYPDLLKAIAVSVDDLPAEDRERYLDLAVFPEDEAIDEGALQVLWDLTPAKTRVCMDRLVARSLATRQENAFGNALLLHDLHGDFVRKEREKRLHNLHVRLVDGYRAMCQTGWHTGPDDGYFYQWLPYHLHRAGRQGALIDLLFDPAWLRAKLHRTDPASVIADFRALPPEREVNALGNAIRLSNYAVARDTTQLVGQLLGRLGPNVGPRIERLLSTLRSTNEDAQLLPIVPTLEGPFGQLSQTLAGHDDSVTDVEVLPDKCTLVTASADHTLGIWDSSAGKIVLRLKGHSHWVSSVTFLPLSGLLVSASDDSTLRVWEPGNGEALRTLAGHLGRVLCVTAIPGSDYVVSGGSDCTIRIWDVINSKLLFCEEGHEGPINGLASLSGGRRLLSASADKTLKLWDLDKKCVVRTFEGHEEAVNDVATFGQGERAISASADKTLKIWRLADGKILRTLTGHTSFVNGVTVARDGSVAISASADHDVRTWDLTGGSISHRLAGHTSPVNAVALADDDRQIISVSADRTIRMWNCITGERLGVLPRSSTPVAVREDTKHEKRVLHVCVSSDASLAVSVAEDGSILQWDAMAGTLIRELSPNVDGVAGAALLPDERYLLTCSNDGILIKWSMETGEAVSKQEVPLLGISHLAIFPDGDRIVVGSRQGSWAIWDTCREKLVRPAEHTHHGAISALAIPPDGAAIIVASADSTLTSWNPSCGKRLQMFAGHTERVTGVAILSEDLFVSSSEDTTVNLWSFSSQSPVRTLTEHALWVSTVASCQQSHQFVSASFDRTIVHWDMRGATPVRRGMFTGDGAILACAIVPFGRRVIAGDATGAVHFLRFNEDHAVSEEVE